VAGVRVMTNIRMLINSFLLTGLVWISAYGVIASYCKAFGLTLPWYAPLIVVVISNFGMALPLSPGAIGVAHFCYVFSLGLFHVDKSTGLSFATVVHAVGCMTVILVGMYCTWKEGLSLMKLSTLARDEK